LGKSIAGSPALILGIIAAAGVASAGTAVGNGMPAGIAWGQTARLNVVSPPNAVAPCTARLQFFDRSGNVLAASSANVQPGTLVSLDLAAAKALRGTREGRAQIHALVRVSPTRRSSCRGVVSTLELFDNRTLKTELVVVPPNPIIR